MIDRGMSLAREPLDLAKTVEAAVAAQRALLSETGVLLWTTVSRPCLVCVYCLRSGLFVCVCDRAVSDTDRGCVCVCVCVCI